MLTERYASRILGVLSCFDRILIMGTLPDICHARAFTRELRSGSSPARIRRFPPPCGRHSRPRESRSTRG